MKKSWIFASMVAFASLAIAQEGTAPPSATGIVAGKMLVSTNNARLDAVYQMTEDGSAQLIVDGKIMTVPAATLSVVDGQMKTSLTKGEIRKLH